MDDPYRFITSRYSRLRPDKAQQVPTDRLARDPVAIPVDARVPACPKLEAGLGASTHLGARFDHRTAESALRGYRRRRPFRCGPRNGIAALGLAPIPGGFPFRLGQWTQAPLEFLCHRFEIEQGAVRQIRTICPGGTDPDQFGTHFEIGHLHLHHGPPVAVAVLDDERDVLAEYEADGASCTTTIRLAQFRRVDSGQPNTHLIPVGGEAATAACEGAESGG